MNSIRSYSELIRLPTFKQRYEYLRIGNDVSGQTFAGSRYLNQRFYMSQEWKEFRNKMIFRDLGHDLAMLGEEFTIQGSIYLHHLNPLTKEDLLNNIEIALDPENVVCVSFKTHNAIHYGSFDILECNELVDRTPNDTVPWKGGI